MNRNQKRLKKNNKKNVNLSVNSRQVLIIWDVQGENKVMGKNKELTRS